MIIPTTGQEQGMKLIEKWYKNQIKQCFVLSGYAGTGKTTLALMLPERLGLSPEEIAFVSFTGKAVMVLMEKGIYATTIHSRFFELKKFNKYDDDGNIIMKNGRPREYLKFIPKKFIDPNIKLIWIDEFSMVDETLKKVILGHGIPVIATGDEAQIPPIFGESPFTKEIDFRLWEITRQAKDNGIITLATMIREGKPLNWYMNFNNQAWVMPKSFLTDKQLLKADMILTTKNKTRDAINSKIRFLHGHYGTLPEIGDKLVCRKNAWNMSLNGIALINGTVGQLINPIQRDQCNLRNNIFRMDFQPDYAVKDNFNYYESIPCDYKFLNSPCGVKSADKYNFGLKFEYGECITVHMSQGSQFNSIIYYDDPMGDTDFMRRIRYTAVTRAINKAYLFI